MTDIINLFKNNNIEFTKFENFDFCKFLHKIKSSLEYIKSGSTGHTFKGTVDKNLFYAIKIIPYIKKERYGDITNNKRPENVEIEIQNKLSNYNINFIKCYEYFHTNIEQFIKLDIDENKEYTKFKENFYKDIYYDKVLVIISEWADGGDLLDFIRKYKSKINHKQWKIIFFQVLFILASIQFYYPSFRHNDLKPNNILIKNNFSKKKYIIYTLDNYTFKVPNIGIELNISDFDFSCIDGEVDNIKMNSTYVKKAKISKTKNRYYDLHFFFNFLINASISSELLDEKYSSDEIISFINYILPEKLRKSYKNNKCRLIYNIEYKIPFDILKEYPYFKEFII